MIINILIGVITTICIWLTVIFLMSSKYQSVIEPLNDDEFVLKECYGVGFHLMKLFRVNMKGTIASKMRKDAVVIYGEKYAEYYVSVYYAQRLTFSLFLVDVFMFTLCICSPEDRLMMIVLMLVVLAVVNYYFIIVLSEKIKKNSDNYLMQFPNVASTMALLINAGMIVTEAWEIIAYEDDDELHKQMQITMEEIENGVSLKTALNRFANRCATPELRKFTSSIIQGLEKGNKELANSLTDMSKELWHEKKQKVLQLAEMAGNKVLIPIMMMFVGILIMVMAPIVTNMF